MSDQLLTLRDESGHNHLVIVAPDGRVTIGSRTLQVRTAPDGSVLVSGEGQAMAWSAAIGDTRWVFVDGQVFAFDSARATPRRRATAAHHSTLTAPMPATVRKLHAAPGDAVRKGEVLIVLEAMKMELPVRAPADGRIEKVHCREGDQVQPGVSLIELDET